MGYREDSNTVVFRYCGDDTMREIKFRGKRLDNGEWVYGNHYGTGQQSLELFWMNVADGIIDPETVGQYTGRKGSNGKKICEGDIVDWYADELVNGGSKIERIEYKKCIVVWVDEFAGLMLTEQDQAGAWHFYEDMKIEIIGNIHENPELLEEKE